MRRQSGNEQMQRQDDYGLLHNVPLLSSYFNSHRLAGGKKLCLKTHSYDSVDPELPEWAILPPMILMLTLALSLSTAWSNTPPKTMVFLGDSLTAGYGLTPEAAYPALVQNYLDVKGRSWKVVNAGVSGDTTTGGLARLNWILKQKPTAVIIALGANDMLRGIDPKVTRSNLKKLIEQSQSQGAKVALLGMKATPNLGAQFRAQFDSIYPELAREYKIPLLKFMLESVATQKNLNQVDAIHPNAEGQKRVAKDVIQALDSWWIRLEKESSGKS